MPKRAVGECRRRGKVWYVRYYWRGQRVQESSGSTKRADAERLLRSRLTAKDENRRIDPRVAKLRFHDAATDLINDYKMTGKTSIRVMQRRIDKHLAPYFGTMLMAHISTSDVRAYVAHRQAETEFVRKAFDLKRPDGTVRRIPEARRKGRVSNAEINRELTTLKRMFSLAVKDEKLADQPHIPLLKENNVRTGFFEPDQFRAMRAHLPAEIQPVVTFAYLTGWRIASEVLPLEWRHVDFAGGEIRLDAGTTKNGDGRVFPMTDDLRALLTAQKAGNDALKKAGHISPWVFWRMVAKGRGGDKDPQRIVSFTKAWQAACRAAGCPGRIPHDLRRTAVRNFVRRGVPDLAAMTLTGHKTRSVFERYNIVSAADLHRTSALLNGLNPATGPGTGPNALAVAVGTE